MCRYAMSGPYKVHYVCFDCQKSFKQRPDEDLPEKEQANRTFRCPSCGVQMCRMGRDFRAPKQGDHKQWRKLRLLYAHGVTFESCGCGGPGMRPAKLQDVPAFLQAMAAPCSEGERLLERLMQY